MVQSPLKFATPSPKLSERVTSPLATSSIATAAMVMSPSRGVGIGSTWSAALDEQLNKPEAEKVSQKLAGKDSGKENNAGSKIDSLKSSVTSKPTKIIIDREILSPELVRSKVDSDSLICFIVTAIL